MNQRADSLKENVTAAAKRPLICHQGCFLSHTMRCGIGQNKSRDGLSAYGRDFLRWRSVHLRSSHPSIRAVGFCSTGTS